MSGSSTSSGSAGSLIPTILQVLNSAPTRKIDFRMGFRHVRGVDLIRIAQLVMTRFMGFSGIAVDVQKLPKDVGAEYVPHKDMLVFPKPHFGVTASERAAIVHECVHAMHDKYGCNIFPTNWGAGFMAESDDEAAAYIASSLYYRYETGKRHPPGSSTNIFYYANNIAERIEKSPGAVVTWDESLELRRIIADSNIYKFSINTITTCDG